MVESVKEPTVSIHGVPKSQYESGQAMPTPDTSVPDTEPTGGGGIGDHFRRHWVAYSLGLAAAGVVVAYLAYRNNQNNSYAVTTGNSATGQVGTPQTIDSSWGSQLDADYQQLTSVETTNTGLLQSILNGITGGTTTTPAGPTSPGTGPAPSPRTPIMGNTPIHNPILGNQFSFEGIMYQLVPGPHNVIYGVQDSPGNHYTNQQLINAPLGFGVGYKRVLTTGG